MPGHHGKVSSTSHVRGLAPAWPVANRDPDQRPEPHGAAIARACHALLVARTGTEATQVAANTSWQRSPVAARPPRERQIANLPPESGPRRSRLLRLLRP